MIYLAKVDWQTFGLDISRSTKPSRVSNIGEPSFGVHLHAVAVKTVFAMEGLPVSS